MTILTLYLFQWKLKNQIGKILAYDGNIERYENYVDIEFDDIGRLPTTRDSFRKAIHDFRLEIINHTKEARINAVSKQRIYLNMLKKNNPTEF